MAALVEREADLVPARTTTTTATTPRSACTRSPCFACACVHTRLAAQGAPSQADPRCSTLCGCSPSPPLAPSLLGAAAARARRARLTHRERRCGQPPMSVRGLSGRAPCPGVRVAEARRACARSRSPWLPRFRFSPVAQDGHRGAPRRPAVARGHGRAGTHQPLCVLLLLLPRSHSVADALSSLPDRSSASCSSLRRRGTLTRDSLAGDRLRPQPSSLSSTPARDCAPGSSPLSGAVILADAAKLYSSLSSVTQLRARLSTAAYPSSRSRKWVRPSPARSSSSSSSKLTVPSVLQLKGVSSRSSPSTTANG